LVVYKPLNTYFRRVNQPGKDFPIKGKCRPIYRKLEQLCSYNVGYWFTCVCV